MPGTVGGKREKEIEPDWNSLKCSEAKSHDEADLCEQRRMSKAAEQTVFLNKIQIVVGIVGFAFVIWNLWYVRKATLAAIAAAEISDKSAEAAIKGAAAAEVAVAVAQDTARRQLRAYIAVEPMGGDVVIDEPINIPIRLKNYGQTPARNCCSASNAMVRKLPYSLQAQRDESGPILPTDEAAPKHILQPGDVLVVYCRMDIPLPAVTHDHLKADRAAVFCSGVVYYEDVFGEPHETHFRYEFSGDECFKTGRLRMSREGNDAT